MISEKRTYIYLSLTVSVNHASFESCTIPLLKSNILSFARGKPYRNQEEVHKARLSECSFPVRVLVDVCLCYWNEPVYLNVDILCSFVYLERCLISICRNAECLSAVCVLTLTESVSAHTIYMYICCTCTVYTYTLYRLYMYDKT